MATRLGLFGGTFDPPHNGHLIVASEAYEALGLDRLLMIPNGSPAHREERPGATAEQRLRMVEVATDGDPRLEIDDLEVRRPGPTYTVDTLREFRRREPDAELVLLLGIDQFRKLNTWRAPELIAGMATLAVLSRDGETGATGGAYEAVNVPVSRIDISGTLIRQRVAEGMPIRYYVPDRVAEIIEIEKLYRDRDG